MRFSEIISNPEPHPLDVVGSFMHFAAKELGLESLPEVIILQGDEIGPSFGSYRPGHHTIKLQAENRHPVDVMRTLAHEMVHFSQDLQGVLVPGSGDDGSEHENQANSEAGRIMRLFGKAHPEIFSLQAITSAPE